MQRFHATPPPLASNRLQGVSLYIFFLHQCKRIYSLGPLRKKIGELGGIQHKQKAGDSIFFFLFIIVYKKLKI